MKTKPSIKLVKREHGAAAKHRAKVELSTGPKSWSTSVRSWVVEFHQRVRSESLPPFDSLFKEALVAEKEK